MRIAADENIDPSLIDWLRVRGHDVLSIQETAHGMPDPQVLALAVEEARILLTADKDFGLLVFRWRLSVPGVILVRFRTTSREELLELFASHWPDTASNALGNFTVVTNRTLRVRPLP